MFIQTEIGADQEVMSFLPGREVLAGASCEFKDMDSAAAAPLAQRLLSVAGVESVTLHPHSITIRKQADQDWQILKAPLLGAIMEHFVSGQPVVLECPDASGESEELEDGVSGELRELIDTRIRPAAQQAGGDVSFKGFEDGVVLLAMQGAAYSLKDRIEAMLRHYVPEVTEVRDFLDSIEKPGLDTPQGREVRRVLAEEINPAVAGHGGHVSLVDVQDDKVYIRLEGGCQGCGMADVTLKQGIETGIRRAVPSITAVLDVTDHAGGTNPYFQPGKV
ncbi:MAG: NifU family protein [Pseudomonadota bacterium]